MIIDLVQIFRSRRDPRRAAKLAGRLAQNQAIDRLMAPLTLIHILLWGVAFILSGVAGLLLHLATLSHGSVILLALVPLGLSGFAVTISLGLKKGLDRIRDYAGQMGDRGVDRAASMGQSLKTRRDALSDPSSDLTKPASEHVDER